jgi:hypothetical protein
LVTAKKFTIELQLKGSTTMTVVVPTLKSSEIVYPSADGKPIAGTYDHIYAILRILAVLK